MIYGFHGMAQPLLAEVSIADVLRNGADAARAAAETWDNTWGQVLGGGSVGGTNLYGELAQIGTLFAVGSLAFLMFEFWRDLQEGRPMLWERIIWPLLVATLLANNAVLLSEITFAMRGIINTANSTVIDTTLIGVKLDEQFQRANTNVGLRTIISGKISECQLLTGEAQVQCLEQKYAEIEALLDAYESTIGSSQAARDLRNELDQIRAAEGGDPTPGLFNLTKGIWWPLVTSLLFYLQIAYQHLLEAALLLTALLGPTALGGSVLPYGPKPLFAWMTAFFSVGIAKLSFNIVVGVAAVAATNTSGSDPGWFVFFAGLLAPLLASTLAVGGGLAIWAGLSSAASSGTQIAARAALGKPI